MFKITNFIHIGYWHSMKHMKQALWHILWHSGILVGIYSDTLSGIYAGIFSGIYSDILFCHSVWHSILAFYSASILAFWHSFSHSIWTIFRNLFWHSLWHWHCRTSTASRSHGQCPLSSACSWGPAGSAQGEGQGKEEVTLINSRDPHLVGNDFSTPFFSWTSRNTKCSVRRVMAQHGYPCYAPAGRPRWQRRDWQRACLWLCAAGAAGAATGAEEKERRGGSLGVPTSGVQLFGMASTTYNHL